METAWSPSRATEEIRRKARQNLRVDYTKHARDQLKIRGVIMGDVLHVLKHGFVFEEAEPSTQSVCFKYKMECTTPNSGGRTLRVIVIPSTANAVKIVTVMWKNEHGRWS